MVEALNAEDLSVRYHEFKSPSFPDPSPSYHSTTAELMAYATDATYYFRKVFQGAIDFYSLTTRSWGNGSPASRLAREVSLNLGYLGLVESEITKYRLTRSL